MSHSDFVDKMELQALEQILAEKEAQLQQTRHLLIQTQHELQVLQNSTHRAPDAAAAFAQEMKYTIVIENMALGLIEVDNEGTIRKVNNAFCEMTGYAHEELLGIKDDILLTPEWKEYMAKQTALRTQQVSSAYEIQIRRKDGTLRWLLISGSPIYNQAYEVVGSIGIHFDLSHQKSLYAELEKAKKAAEEAQEAEKLFLANISHEIRTPLNALLGMAHLLEGTSLDKQQQEYLELLQISGKYLQKLVSDVLDFSRIESGTIEIQAAPFDLNALLNELIRSFEHVTDKSRIKFETAIDASVQGVYTGDEALLRQILVNLLSNAFKFTPSGFIRLEAREKILSDGQRWVEFAVRDTGIGIPAEKLDLIFQSYKQATHHIHREFGGSGLGLAITRSLCALLGGTISVESQYLKGAVFRVSLPLTRSEQHTLPPSPDFHGNRLQHLPVLNRVLIAEDNLINRKYLEELIRRAGIPFDSTEDSRAALLYASNTPYDVLLIDLHLVGANGVELIRDIRTSTINQHTPILALTASATPPIREAALAAGADEVLYKPYTPRQLHEKIAALRLAHKLIPPEKTGQSEPIPEPGIWSAHNLADLYLGDAQHALELFSCFLEKHLPETSLLLSAFEHADYTAIKALCHKLKPGFDMVGLQSVSTILHQMELALEATPPDIAALEIYYRQLHALLPAAVQTIHEKIQELRDGTPHWIKPY